MTRKLLVFAVVAALAVGVGCKKKPPSRTDTRDALREAVQKINDDIYKAQGGQTLLFSTQELGTLPLFGGGGPGFLRTGGGRSPLFRSLVTTLNSGGPWDTLVGHWRWETDSFGAGCWNHYATTPLDSIIFEWVWQDSSQQSHHADLSVFNWYWDKVDTVDVLTKVHANLRSDGTSYFRLDLNEVRYGSDPADVRRIDVSVTVTPIRFAFLFNYAPPTASASLRMEITNGEPWYEVGITARDETAPLDEAVLKTGSYKDYNEWTVDITLTDPDPDYIQLVDGEIKHKSMLAAYVKSEKRYQGSSPYLYVWIEYVDGTKESLEELFAGIGPGGGY